MEDGYDKLQVIKHKFYEKILPYVVIIAFLGAVLLPYLPKTYLDALSATSLDFLGKTIFFLEKTSFLEAPTLILISLIIPIFVLTVTLLGKAARLSKEQQDDEEKENKESYDEEISTLKKKIADEPGDTVGLKTKILEIEKFRKQSEEKLENINRKYQTLGLIDAVVKPSLSFSASLFFQKMLELKTSTLLEGFFLFGALLFFFYGLYKIALTLTVVQVISLRSDEDHDKALRSMVEDALKKDREKANPISKELEKALTSTLTALDHAKEPHPYLDIKRSLPLQFSTSSDEEIEFTVELQDDGSKIAKDVEVRFFVPPEITILEDSTYDVFKQRENYIIPNANTAAFNFSKVKKHSYINGTLKIKTPKPGTYPFRYKVECDGYVEKGKSSQIIVN